MNEYINKWFLEYNQQLTGWQHLEQELFDNLIPNVPI